MRLLPAVRRLTLGGRAFCQAAAKRGYLGPDPESVPEIFLPNLKPQRVGDGVLFSRISAGAVPANPKAASCGPAVLHYLRQTLLEVPGPAVPPADFCKGRGLDAHVSGDALSALFAELLGEPIRMPVQVNTKAELFDNVVSHMGVIPAFPAAALKASKAKDALATIAPEAVSEAFRSLSKSSKPTDWVSLAVVGRVAIGPNVYFAVACSSGGVNITLVPYISAESLQQDDIPHSSAVWFSTWNTPQPLKLRSLKEPYVNRTTEHGPVFW